jgi:predicted phosphodiesterase
MRIAIVSDVHGNLTALEAVAADLNRTKPDFVLHGGDLAASRKPDSIFPDRNSFENFLQQIQPKPHR